MKNLAHRWRPHAPKTNKPKQYRCKSCGNPFVPPLPLVEHCIRCATRARGYK